MLKSIWIETKTITNYVMHTPCQSVYVHCFQNSELNLKKRVSEKVYKYICDQIDEHEKTFDNDNIRDFVDHYWRTKKFGEENERKYLTSQYSACKEYV